MGIDEGEKGGYGGGVTVAVTFVADGFFGEGAGSGGFGGGCLLWGGLFGGCCCR